ncbi:uncharacterized protein [Aristolochia californica]|uniref:uncharacterized protein n=1 Tax=Aristolochia californica TaxID=171875 RepID=UPI0035DB3DA8
MESSSWFLRAFRKKSKSTGTGTGTGTGTSDKNAQLLQFGITEQLQDFVKGFTLDTFKNFPLLPSDDRPTSISDSSATTSSVNVRNDLSGWQEQHATLVLSTVKEISQLRYALCPRHLKDEQFWGIYFALVKSYLVPYEIRAIQEAKLKMLKMEEGRQVAAEGENAYEVEMIEPKGRHHRSP